jgi:tRNA dimethylallyltransferase
MTRIPIICGPTGSGKTAVALELATQYPVEIISADSRQLVRRLDIGTAKPTAEERRLVPFHLIDLIEPGERYSAFRFIGDATRAISEILKRGHLPLVVGGTGLYLRGLTDGVVEIEEPDIQLREKLEKEAESIGPDEMHRRLTNIDPLEAARIHPNNRIKVIRALEIFYLTGKTKSELTATGSYRKGEYEFDYFCLSPDREQLYARINRRVEEMLEAGWLEEVKQLVDDGFADQVRAANIIGYKELLGVLDGQWSLEEAASQIKQDTRRYAKRQVTWFRHQAKCRFFKASNELQQALRFEPS